MTEKQIKLYKYIREYKLLYGKEPTIEQVCMATRKAKGCIKTMLYKIRDKGFISIDFGNIKLLK